MNAKRPGTYIVHVKGYQEESRWEFRAPGTNLPSDGAIDPGGPELNTYVEEVVSTSFELTIGQKELILENLR